MAETGPYPSVGLRAILPGVPNVAGVDLATEVKFGSQLDVSNLAPNALQLATILISSTTILNMNAAPVTVLAGVAGKTIIVNRALLRTSVTSTHYAAGGAIGLVYETSGNAATGTIPASVIAASTNAEGIMSGISVVSAQAKGIQITNATGAFTTGTGTGTLYLWYQLI